MTFQRKSLPMDDIYLLAVLSLILNAIGCKIHESKQSIQEPITSSTRWSKIKSVVGDCATRKSPGGTSHVYYYIQNVPGGSTYLDEEQTKAGHRCKTFKLSDFSPTTPSIMYAESQGRLGNQLLGYAMLSQLRLQLGVSTFMDYDMKLQLIAAFTPDSIKLPVLHDTYCNPQDIPWEMWRGKMADLLTNENLRKGRFIWLYKPTDPEDFHGGYRPEDHPSSEAAQFMLGYIRYLMKTLTFYPRVQTRVNIALKKIAEQMHLKPKEVTYVGIHNRRTDHMDFLRHKLKLVDIEVLGEDFFLSGMEYFRGEYDNVAFVYVSDDMPWGLNTFKNIRDLHFIGAGQNLDKDTGAEFLDPDAAAYDLALMVNCNHTIISRGTYSMWAAWLAGGEYYSEYGAIPPPELIYEGNDK